MGLFDAISGVFNPDIISTYNDIINNHAEAFQRLKGRQIVGTLSELFWHKPTYKDKKYIAQHKHEILLVEAEIEEEKAYQKRRTQIINVARQYPHAFYALLKELSISAIPDFNYTLPGNRKSNRAKRLEAQERSKKSTVLSRVNSFEPIFRDYGYIQNKVVTAKPKRSLETLSKDEYEKIFPHLNSLSTQEAKLLKQLKDEDNQIKFEDEVLDNNKRAKYYKQYLASQHKADSNIEFCVTHIPELDRFIQQSIHTEYLELRRKYPKGVQYCEDYEIGYGQQKEEIVVEKSASIPIWENVVRTYENLKKKYPIGLAAFERYNSFDDGKNSASLTMEEVIQCEDEVKRFEENAPISKFFDEWLHTQKEFASKCRNTYNQYLEGWGCYTYDIDFNVIKPNGDGSVEPFKVWQLFCESFSLYDSVTTNPYREKWAEAIEKNKRFLSGSLIYRSTVYDKILSFIDYLNKLYPQEIEVVLANSNTDETNTIDKHFSYLIEKIKERGIVCRKFTRNPSIIEEKVHYVIIELITSNSHLQDICKSLLNTKAKCFETCQKPHRFSCFSNIVYISLRKEFDDAEAKELINIKIQEQEEELRRTEEAEKKRREKEERERRLQQQKELEKSEILSCVSSWHSLFGRFQYSYLLNYYPTTCDFDATEDEWEDRWTVWNFKNTPGKTSATDHETALQTVIPQIKAKLVSTFGTSILRKLTLVCIPASSVEKTKARYEVFSDRICRETGMTNAYRYLQVISSSEEKKFGGRGITANNVSFDADFFRGKYILLFDDVITKGESMLRFKRKMEDLGAIVVGGISIGKTKHNRI